jgi:hypothetical protein
MSSDPKLKFKVAPHIVEDLGLNLYTNLPRVLVEFIANAYDADSPSAHIRMDKARIDAERKVLKARWEEAKVNAEKSGNQVPRLAEMTLPDDVTIEIFDTGHGMTRDDLNDKFLVAGRRRRGRGNSQGVSPGGRVLMGRKGLGKLAGFGVAQNVTVVTRASGERHATRITLRYTDLISVTDTHEIPIEEERVENGGGIPKHGTRIILSRLLYEPLGARLETIEHRAADHFAQIDPGNFQILLNDSPVEPTPRKHVYGWPKPDLPVVDLVAASYQIEDGRTFTYQYRLRFVEDRQALPAKERGIRVYAHKRLAAAPSLLDADTNMHGFRMTDYLDGVVYADFIDDQPEDYIATDRMSLRWESPLLSPMHVELSKAIKEACYARQRARDSEMEKEVKEDEFTKTAIEKAALTKREEKVALRIASAVSSLHKQGFQDEGYRTQFQEVLDGLGRGELLSTLATLAREENPEFDRAVAQVTRLTAEQLEGFYKYARARIDGISALRKIVMSVDFKKKKNEKTLHRLLKQSPWLMDPTFFEFLTSDKTEKTMFKQIEKELKIDLSVDSSYDPDADDEVKAGGQNERPDLVFLLGNSALSRLVIVELKAPNTPLYGQHFRQLQGYVRRAERWLKRHNREGVKVEGLLIGTFGRIGSRAEDVEWLEAEMTNSRNQGQCRVFGIDRILELTQDAHKELLDVWNVSRETDESTADTRSKRGKN